MVSEIGRSGGFDTEKELKSEGQNKILIKEWDFMGKDMAAKRIEQDHWRFRQIVRGQIRQNLRKYMSRGEILTRKGKDVVSVPIPQIEIPRFRYGVQQAGGVGQGEGEKGEPFEGEGGGAGDMPGEHPLSLIHI
ncbi:MAG: DUF444 family protein, partial [Planctomycetota bacterium]|nr:DUF444 family protein [Planctomycetota bacterium]